MDAEQKNMTREASPPVDTESATVQQPQVRSPAKAQATPAQGQIEGPSDHYARCLRDTAGAAFMYMSMSGLFQQADAVSFVKFRNKLLADAGNPTDPIEIMLIEQIALAHLNIGRMHFKSATAEGLEAVKVYGALAIALTVEFRRSALALSAYRAAKAPPNATAGALAASVAETGEASSKNDPRSGLPNTQGDINDAGNTIPFRAEPTASGGGKTEHTQEKRAHAKRTRTAVRRCAR